MKAWLLLAVLLAGCGQRSSQPPVAAPGVALESAAIEAGVIPDPHRADLTGLYARDTDKVCVLAAPADFRLGVSVDYGEGQGCSASGSVRHLGEVLTIALGEGGCRFDARFDGDRILFPGSLPEACQKLCTRRASLAGLQVAQVSAGPSEASATRDSRGRLLCPAG